MLMIKFYSNFCRFHRLYVLKMGIQLEHEKINWNAELWNQKAEREANKEEAINPCQFRKAANFHSLRTLQPYFLTFFVSLFDFFPNYP